MHSLLSVVESNQRQAQIQPRQTVTLIARKIALQALARLSILTVEILRSTEITENAFGTIGVKPRIRILSRGDFKRFERVSVLTLKQLLPSQRDSTRRLKRAATAGQQNSQRN
jgi:hypothetical protein